MDGLNRKDLMPGLNEASSTTQRSCARSATLLFWVAVWALVLGAAQPLQGAVLGSGELYLAGTELRISPETQTVPLDLPTLVETEFVGFDPSQGSLPPELRIVGNLTGPEISGSLELQTVPNEPFRIPRFRLEGEYILDNIRLVDGDDFLAWASPRTVSINVTQILVTSVDSRPLTREEIDNLGLVIDENRYQALNLTFGFAVFDNTISYSMPVVYDLYGEDLDGQGLRVFPAANVPLPEFGGGTLPPSARFRPQLVPFRLDLEVPQPPELPHGGCSFEEEECREKVPPAPPMVGVILFPTDLRLLHQFFTVVLFVQNGAPEGDPLVVRDLSAKVKLPSGLREASTEPPTPLGVPVPVRVPGADGELGTADDLSVIFAQARGEAEFTVEGLKEGTHVVEFDLEGIVDGLPGGAQRVVGKAKGAVVVRDPNLGVTIHHPMTVRSGEEYPLIFTVSNTGNTLVNDLDIELPASRLSGVELVDPAANVRNIIELLPGDSATVEFQVRSLRTGRVVATSVKTGSQIDPHWEFSLGVGIGGVPLSPDTLVLPQASQTLPAGLLESALRVIGLGHSLSVAPEASLAAGLPRLSKATVNERIYRVTQTGRHLTLGEDLFDAIAIMAAELYGARDKDFDWSLLLQRVAGARGLASEFGSVLRSEVSSLDELFERLTTTTHFLGPQAALVDGDGTLEVVSRLSGKTLAGVAADGEERIRELPFAELFGFDDGQLGFLTVPEDDGYRMTMRKAAGGAASLRILVPEPSGALRTLRWSNVVLGTSGSAWVDVSRGETTFALDVDADGDGFAEASIPAQIEVLTPRPFQVLTARQNSDIDPSGHVLEVLLSADVDLASLYPRDPERFVLPDNVSNGGLMPVEEDIASNILGSTSADNPFVDLFNSRLIRVIFSSPVSPLEPLHTLTVNSLESTVGQSLGQQTVPVVTTASLNGIIVEGRVIGPDGQPVPFAEVTLRESDLSGIGNDVQCVRHVTAATLADGNGNYRFPYVRETACGDVFSIEGRDLVRNKKGSATGRVRFIGSTQELDVLMLGRGTLHGRVTYADGTVPPGLQVFSLNPVFDDGHRAHVDQDGVYNISDVAVGTVQLVVHDELGQFAYATVELPVSGAVVETDIILQDLDEERWTGQLRGTVVGVDGEPVVDAWVALYVGGQLIETVHTGVGGEYDFGVVPATTDDDPATVDPGLTAEIEAFPTGSSVSGAQLFFEIRKDQINEVEVQLSDARGTVEGHVYSRSVNGVVAPLAGMTVWIPGLPFNTVTDELGYYRMEDIFVGAWRIRAADHVTGRQGSATTSVGSTSEPAVADIYFDEGLPQGGVTGRVVDYDGVTPVVGAIVHLTGGVWAVRWYHEAITDSQGRFVIPGVGPGQGWVSAVSGSDGGLAPFTVRFPGDTPTVEVKFRKGTIRIRTVAIQEDGSTAPVCSTAVGRFTTVPPKYENIVAVDDRFKTYFTCPLGEEATAEFLEIEALEGPYEFYIYNAFHGNQKIARSLVDGEIAEHVIEFQPNGSIGGVVYDIDGQPAVGATVHLRSPPPPPESPPTGAIEDYEVQTDSAGRYLFELIPRGGYHITFTHEAGAIFRTDQVLVSLNRSGEHLEVDIELPAQGSVVGWVQDGAGLPVAGAVVELSERSFPHRKLVHNADELGNFAFHNVFVGDVSVRAQVPSLGGLATTKELAVEAENQDVYTVMTLESVGEITGQVMYPDNLGPAAGSRVELHTGGFFDVVTADSNGEFRFRLLPVETQFRVSVFDPASGRFGTGAWVTLDYHGQVKTTEVVLEARGEVHGRVIDGAVPDAAGEAGLPATPVRLWSRGLQWFKVYATTDQEGYFKFGGIPQGDFELSVHTGDAGRARFARSLGALQEEDEVVTVDLYLTPFATVAGRVLGPPGSAEEGSLFSGEVNTRIRRGLAGVVGASFDNPFEFGGIVPGQGAGYEVIAEEVGGPHRVSSGILRVSSDDPDGRLDIDLQMPAIGSTTVSVFDSFGDPVAHADVVVRNVFVAGGERFYGNTGNDHRITFDGLIEGSIRASVTDPLSGLKGSNSSQLALEGEDVEITVNLQSTGTVRGVAVLADGTTPAEGAVVSVFVNAWSKYFLTTTDEQGAFEFDGLPMSSLTLTVQEHFGPGTIQRFGSLSSNGQVLDYGTLVLDDRDPYVVSIEPATGARDVLESTHLTVVFSEPIDVARFSSSHIGVERFGGSNVSTSTSWSADGTTVTVMPTSSLASATAYVVRVTRSIVDLAGRQLAWEQRSSFTTRDYIPPTVIDIVPRNGAVQVPVDSNIEVRFSEPITDLLMPTLALFDITDGGSIAQTAVPQRSSELRYVLTPSQLSPDRQYRVEVSAAQDVAGNVMPGVVSTTFWTPDETPPQIAWVSPADGTTFTAGDDIAVEATATDNRGVDRVEFAIADWTFVATSGDSQFATTLLAPVMAVAGNVVVTATAIDIFGNQTAVTRSFWIAPHNNAEPPVVDPGCWYDGDYVAPGLAPRLDTLFTDDERIESYAFFVDGVELDRLSPVNQPTASKNFGWQPPEAAQAPPGTSFLLRVEARDFAGNVGFFEATMSVPADGPLLRADQILNPSLYTDQPVYLADGEFLILNPQPFHRLTLLRDAIVRTEDAPGLDRVLDLEVDETLTMQCLSRIEADSVAVMDIFAKEGAVLETPQVDVATLISEGTVSTTDLVATGAVDVAADGVVTAATLTAPDVLIADQGAIRATGEVFDVNISGTLTIEDGALLDSSAAGYAGGVQASPTGHSPSWVAGSENGAGGSHGGVGTTYLNPWYQDGSQGPPGELFDSLYQPRLPGSGGAYRHGDAGAGGGFLDLEVGTLVLDGEIASRGESFSTHDDPTDSTSGAGAGGSVLIRAGSISGAGQVDVSGGSNNQDDCADLFHWPTAGAGGGGRLAIYATAADALIGFDPATQTKAWGGFHGCNNTAIAYAAPGTVLIHDAASTYGDLWLDSGVTTSGVPREGPSTELLTLGGGTIVGLDVQGADAWLTAAEILRARWLGVWVTLSDATDTPLGDFKVLELDAQGRALLAGAATVAGSAVAYHGEYHFDQLHLRNGANVASQDLLTVPDVVFDGGNVGLGSELVVETLTVADGTRLFPLSSSTLQLTVTGTMTIEAGATVDVTAQGYEGTTTDGEDPAEAPSWVTASKCAAGGSHGGRGSIYGYWDCSWGPAGEVYGSVYEPGLSGGGGGMIGSVHGGDGGGFLAINAGTLILDGELLARGQTIYEVDPLSGWDSPSGGGAGGSILVRAAQLSGSGLIDASGGTNDQEFCVGFHHHRSAGAGGGGRVGLYIDTLSGFDPATQVRAWGGYHGCAGNAVGYAAPGTILTHTSDSTYGTLRVDAGPQPGGAAPGLSTFLPTLGSGAVTAVEVIGSDLWLTGDTDLWPRWIGAWTELLDVDDNSLGLFRVAERDAAGRLRLVDAAVAAAAASYQGHYIFDGVEVLNGADLTAVEPIEAAAVTFEGVSEISGDVVAVDVLVKSGATVRPATGSDLRFQVSGTMTVEAGATVDVTAMGYEGSTTDGEDPAEAPSWVTASKCAAGGSHGGRGSIYGYWDCSWGPAGEVYGSVYEPWLSGGGGGMIGGVHGGDGGGRLFIDAGHLVLDGELLARGQTIYEVDPLSGWDSPSGGGAGGSILIRTPQLSGSGLIDASGGTNDQEFCVGFHHHRSAGAGGGGRVGLYADTLSGFDPATQVRAWPGYHGCAGNAVGYAAPGTILTHTLESTHGSLRVDAGPQPGGVAPGLNTQLPSLSGGTVDAVEVVGLDAWLTSSNLFHPRWLGASVRLTDATGGDLGLFWAIEIDAAGRVLLQDAGSVAASATEYSGEYWFDTFDAAGGALWIASDPVRVLAHQVSIADSDVSASEGDAAGVVFTVTLSEVSTIDVEVGYTTLDGTALAGSDYVAAAGTLVIPAGQLSMPLVIDLISDTIPEPQESFELELQAVRPGFLVAEATRGTATLDDDDNFPQVSINDRWIVEGVGANTQVELMVTLSPAASEQVTVDYQTTPDTAVGGVDYTELSGTLVFLPGESIKTLSVEILADTLEESEELFWLDLTAATRADLLDARGEVTIYDGQSPVPDGPHQAGILVDYEDNAYQIVQENPSWALYNNSTHWNGKTLAIVQSGDTLVLQTRPEFLRTDHKLVLGVLNDRWNGYSIRLGDWTSPVRTNSQHQSPVYHEEIEITIPRDVIKDETFEVTLDLGPNNSSSGYYITSYQLHAATDDQDFQRGVNYYWAGTGWTWWGNEVDRKRLVSVTDSTSATIPMTTSSPQDAHTFFMTTLDDRASSFQIQVGDWTSHVVTAPQDGGSPFVELAIDIPAGTIPAKDFVVTVFDTYALGSLKTTEARLVRRGKGSAVVDYEDDAYHIAQKSDCSLYSSTTWNGKTLCRGWEDGATTGATLTVNTRPEYLFKDHKFVLGTLNDRWEGWQITVNGWTSAIHTNSQHQSPEFHEDLAFIIPGEVVTSTELDITLTRGANNTSEPNYITRYRLVANSGDQELLRGINYVWAGSDWTWQGNEWWRKRIVYVTDTEHDTATIPMFTSGPSDPHILFLTTHDDKASSFRVQIGDWVSEEKITPQNGGSQFIELAVEIPADTIPDNDFEVTVIDTTVGTLYIDEVRLARLPSAPPEPTSEVSLTSSTASAVESDPAGMVFAVELSEPTTVGVTVDWQLIDGSAQAGLDYLGTHGTLAIPAGQTAATITVPLVADEIVELAETFELHLTDAANALLGAMTQAVATIIEDDLAQVSVSDVQVTEIPATSQGPAASVIAELIVTLDAAAPAQVSVSYLTTAGTAAAGVDFAEQSGSLVFLPGEVSKTLAIEVFSDAIEETDEVFWLDLTSAIGGELLDDRGEVTIYHRRSQLAGALVDFEDDAYQIVQENPSWVLYSNGTPWNGKTIATVQTGDRLKLRTRPEFLRSDHKLVLGVLNDRWNGYAISIGDWTSPVRTNSQNQSPEFHEEIEITIPWHVITSETFEATLHRGPNNSSSGVFLTGYQLHAGTDDQDFQRAVDYHWEGTGWSWYNALFSRKQLARALLSTPVTIPMTTSSPQDAHVFYLTVLDDRASTFQIQVDGWTSALVTAPQDGGSPFATLAIDIPEGTIPNSEFDVTVIVPAEAEFLYSTEARLVRQGGGSALVDYEDDAYHISQDTNCTLFSSTPFNGKTICRGWATGATTGATLTLNTRPEYFFKDHKLILGTLNDRFEGWQITVNGWTSDFRTNSTHKSPEYHEDIVFIIPGYLVTSSQLDVTLTPESHNTFTNNHIARYQLVANTGDQDFTRGVDYHWRGSEWSWLGAEWNRKRLVFVAEPEGGTATIPMVTSNPVDAHIFYLSTLDDRASSFQIQIGSWTSPIVTAPQDGGSPFVELAVAIPAGTIPTPEFEVTVIDTMAGPLYSTEARLVRLAEASGDPTSEASLSPATVSAAEGDPAGMVFTVELSEPTLVGVTLDYETVADTAQAGVDYVATSGTLAIPAGQTSAQIVVALIADEIVEPNTTFELHLTSATNVLLVGTQAVATIVDDDRPEVSIGDGALPEPVAGSEMAELIVTLSPAPAVEATAAYQTADGTAVAGEDYVAQSGTLVFAPGQATQTISIEVLTDLLTEPTETFTVILSSPSEAVLVDSEGTVTILDPVDAPPVAAFTFDCDGLSCSFDASGSTDDIGIVSYHWDFGDGTTFSDSVSSSGHRLPLVAGGEFAVVLTVTDGASRQDQMTQTVRVTSLEEFFSLIGGLQ